jgi:Protein of unknown function (DUF2380)
MKIKKSHFNQIVILFLLVGVVCLPARAQDKQLKSLAMLEFEIVDDTLDYDAIPAQKQRLKLISQQLRDEFEQKKFYKVLSNEPAAALIADYQSKVKYLYGCNGCEIDIAKKLGVQRVLTAWVQKVSNLILNINIEIKDVATGQIVVSKSSDIRGNNDQSWQHGIKYMVRSMVEKNQGGK